VWIESAGRGSVGLFIIERADVPGWHVCLEILFVVYAYVRFFVLWLVITCTHKLCVHPIQLGVTCSSQFQKLRAEAHRFLSTGYLRKETCEF